VHARFLDWAEAVPWEALQAESGDSAMERELTKAADELTRKERVFRSALFDAHRSDLGELLRTSAVRTGGEAGLKVSMSRWRWS
jgi:hypothetical protein